MAGMVSLDLHYVDPRLVAQYDIENSGRDDTDFYLALAERLNARRIIDLGCGTGVLTRELAAVPERKVWGVDPAAAMLAYAHKQPGAEKVTWLNGDSGVLPDLQADLALMTGNVAQIFLEDTEWQATLRHLHASLRPGGHLAFESRNPLARAWETWAADSAHEVIETPDGPVEVWLDVLGAAEGRVQFVAHNLFLNTGERLDVHSTLRFRTDRELHDSLEAAGFYVQHVYGDWQGMPFTPESAVMVFLAQRL